MIIIFSEMYSPVIFVIVAWVFGLAFGKWNFNISSHALADAELRADEAELEKENIMFYTFISCLPKGMDSVNYVFSLLLRLNFVSKCVQ